MLNNSRSILSRRSMNAKSMRRLGRVLWYIVVVIMSIPFVFPFWWMVASSFKKPYGIFEFPPKLLPRTWDLSNFTTAFNFIPLGRHLFNSLYIAVLVTIGTIIVSTLAGYAFARIRFRGRTLLFLMLMSALMMPAEVTIIPNFLLMKTLKLTNSHIPLIILPIMGGHGVLTTFLMRQFYLNFPSDIEDAAKIDGLSVFGVYWRIALPMARPALAAVAILTFLYSWTLFLEPLILIDSLELFTVPIALRSYYDQYGQPLWGVQLAATTVSVIPILLVFVAAQKQVIQSFSLSGIKG